MEMLEKAKELFSAASAKTGEFVYTQKNNIKIARTCGELKKLYERLGRLTYRKIKGMKVDDNEFDGLIDKLEILKMELAALREDKVEQPSYSNAIVFEDGELVDNNIE